MTNNRFSGGCLPGCPPQCNPCPSPCSPPWQGIRGPTGPMGPEGPAGPRGPIGPIGPMGATGPAGANGMNGAPGATGATGAMGATGATGATGVEGPAASIIPFSIDRMTNIVSDTDGNPYIVDFAGFGSNEYSSIQLQPGDWASNTIHFTEGTFYGASFIVPNDAAVRSISVMVANRMTLTDLPIGTVLRPFVCLATLNPNASQLVYTILPETMTFVEPYIGTSSYIPKYSLRWGTQSNMDVPIAGGTALAIVLGMMTSNPEAEHYLSVSISGSLFID